MDFSVDPDPADPTRLLVTFTPPPTPSPAPMATDIIRVDFELVNEDQCQPVTVAAITFSAMYSSFPNGPNGLELNSEYHVSLTDSVCVVGNPLSAISGEDCK